MKRTILFAVAVFFVISGTGFARNPKPEGMILSGGKWWRMPKIATELDLKSEEQSKLDELYLESKKQLIDLKGNVEKEQLELEQILGKKDFDEAACMTQFKKLTNARTGLSTERFKYLIDIRKLLGFDRYQKLVEKFREQRMNRMRRSNGQKRPMKGGMGKQ